MQNASMATQIQVLNGVIIGAVQHLFSLVPFTRPQLQSINSRIMQAAKLILQVHGRTSSEVAQALTRTLLSESIRLQHRCRLLWTLQLSPHTTGIAPRLLRILSTEKESICPDTHRPWHLETAKCLAQADKDNVPVHLPTVYKDIHHRSTCLGRSFSYERWRRASLKAAKISPVTHTRTLRDTPERQRQQAAYTPPHFTDAPTTYSTTRHFVGMTGAYQRRHTELGEHSFTSPMHITGPGANGSIVSLTDSYRKETQRVISFQYGGIKANMALFRTSKGTKPPHACCFCGSTLDAELWHVLFACKVAPKDRILSVLRSAEGSVIKIITRLLAVLDGNGPLGRRLQQPIDGQTMYEIRRAAEAARDARGTTALTQEYYRAVIYRIITGFTWSDSDILQSSLETQDADTLGNIQSATDTWKKLALAIGFMFRHATKFRNELRKLASTWIRLSSRHLDTIIDICRPHGNGQVVQANQAL
jgi:hypothetical protein